jgi:hypothetical protein
MLLIKGIAWWLNIAGYPLCWIITPAKPVTVTTNTSRKLPTTLPYTYPE